MPIDRMVSSPEPLPAASGMLVQPSRAATVCEVDRARKRALRPEDRSELLSRHFDNRRQVAAYAGLAPTPWQSGSVNREQGISQSGNPRLRTTMIQLAWLWLRHQPRSALTLWFQDRINRNGGRRRKTTIVALARKLLVALWKYVSAGVVIEGAMIRRGRMAAASNFLVDVTSGNGSAARNAPYVTERQSWRR